MPNRDSTGLLPDDETTLLPTGSAGHRAPVGVVRVNLIPPEIAEARRLRGVQLALGGGVLLAVAIVAGFYEQQVGAVHRAEGELSAANAENSRLQAEQQRLGNVNALYGKVDAAKAMLASAKAPQILWSRYLEDVRLRLPERTWLTTLTMTETAAVAGVHSPAATPAAVTGATVGTAAATAPAVGCAPVATLLVGGSGYTHRDVADWLDRLAGLKAVTNPYLTSSTEALAGTTNVPTVAWNTTASLDCQALASAGKG